MCKAVFKDKLTIPEIYGVHDSVGIFFAFVNL